jgi:hypothetical protein
VLGTVEYSQDLYYIAFDTIRDHVRWGDQFSGSVNTSSAAECGKTNQLVDANFNVSQHFHCGVNVIARNNSWAKEGKTFGHYSLVK